MSGNQYVVLLNLIINSDDANTASRMADRLITLLRSAYQNSQSNLELGQFLRAIELLPSPKFPKASKHSTNNWCELQTKFQTILFFADAISLGRYRNRFRGSPIRATNISSVRRDPIDLSNHYRRITRRKH